MAVITISREFGCGGGSIAKQVAQTLDYHFVDKTFIGNVLSQYGIVEFDKEYDALPGFWEKFDAQREKRRDMMVDMLHQVVRAVACHGNAVILGRSGFAVLAGLADTLHVRLQAPLEARVKRVMAQQALTAEQAEELVKESDKVRATLIEEFCGLSWDACHAFDLVINTSKISPDLAVRWVVEAFGTLEKKGDGERTTDIIRVDSILASAVSDELGCSFDHQKNR